MTTLPFDNAFNKYSRQVEQFGKTSYKLLKVLVEATVVTSEANVSFVQKLPDFMKLWGDISQESRQDLVEQRFNINEAN